MITDILRDYNLKNRYKILKIGKEKKYNLIGQKIADGGEKTFLEAQNKCTNVTPEACHFVFHVLCRIP
ncbi:hypothetical protein T10_9631 [Trichinella papuae]|uniref:Uncharacterized protein n=1 Tax=Trichinella papuae TaxID=268474 RepID=A0A0V1M0K5_9BILA|nr:hypothetical protein T10_9631 [Trichinella papuae]